MSTVTPPERYSAAFTATAIGLLAATLVVATLGCGSDPQPGDGQDPVDRDGEIELEATSGDFADAVRLEWEALEGADEYRIERDGQEIAVVTETDYEDEGADDPETIEPGEVTASQGEYTYHVELEHQGESTVASEPHDYEVQAIRRDDPLGEPGADQGYRADDDPDLERRWQHATVDEDEAFDDLLDGGWPLEEATHDYEGAPFDGTPRYYRVALETDQLDRVYTDSAQGYRDYAEPFVHIAGIYEYGDRATGNNVTAHSLIDGNHEIAHHFGTSGRVIETVAVAADGTYFRTLASSLYKFDGITQQWTYDHPDSVAATAVDADGYVYTGTSPGSSEIHKIDAEGEQQWTFEEAATAQDLAVDADGYVYAVAADDTLRKVDAQGEQVWKVGEEADFWNVNAVAVDTDGTVFVGDSTNPMLMVFDADGNELWTDDFGSGSIQDLAVDADGTLYVAHRSSSGGQLRSYDIDAEERDGVLDSGEMRSVAVDPDGTVYSGSRGTVRASDAEGNQQWSVTDYDGPVESIAAEPGPYAAFPDEW